MDEGYIKFTVRLTPGDLPACEGLTRLNEVRTELHDLGLVGAYPDGIGYGNVSIRLADSATFIISGTATGATRELASADYCRVDAFDLARNEVFCTGRVRASSESMSHGAVYQTNPAIRCVIHVHSRALFDFMLANGHPRTSELAAFGTPELAEEIAQLVQAGDLPRGVIVTAGHEEGVIAYGRDVAEARELLLDTAAKSRKMGAK